MKILKFVGIGLLSLVLLLLAVSFFLPSTSRIERSLVMKAQPEAIYDQINTLKNWEKWSTWHQIDPQMDLRYEGPASGVGAKYIWKSENPDAGAGSLTIKSAKPNEEIVSEMIFMETHPAAITYTFEPVAEGTKVTWVMTADMGMDPVGRYMALMMESFVGKDFEQCLANIQQIVERAPATPPVPEVSMR